MSNEVHNIRFGNIILEMIFEGHDYETASVKFKLDAKDGRPTLSESPVIPVRCVFDIAYLIEVSVRLNAVRTEQELLRIKEKKSGKENQTE